MPGTLYIVGTPIGNLGDITLRALNTFRSVDLIAAEDTRHTLQLLNHFDIHKKLMSFHEHSSQARTEELIHLLKEGKDIALVSDAGMPMISDPGYILTRACVDNNIPMSVIPGPSAATSVIALSGADCRQFVFGGFLPAKSAARRRQLVGLASANLPIVLYESPNRVVGLLDDVCAVLGDDVYVCAAREITKVYEEEFRGGADEVRAALRAKGALKGEFALVVDARIKPQEIEDDELREELVSFVADGMSTKDAARYASTVLGVPKKKAYAMLLDMDKNEEDSRG